MGKNHKYIFVKIASLIYMTTGTYEMLEKVLSKGSESGSSNYNKMLFMVFVFTYNITRYV